MTAKILSFEGRAPQVHMNISLYGCDASAVWVNLQSNRMISRLSRWEQELRTLLTPATWEVEKGNLNREHAIHKFYRPECRIQKN